MAAFAPTPPGAWAPPARGVAAARAVAPPPQRSLPRRGLAYPLTPIPRATTTTAALKADTFAPPRFYDFAPDAVAAVRLRHVQVETEALARVAFGLVKSGDKSLAELAASLSTDATSRAAGGDLGWWDPHEGVAANPAGGLLDPAVAAAAVGAVAAPSPLPRSPPAALLAEATRVRPNTLQLVESPAGWHVFVVEDARHALRPTLKLPPRAADAFRHKAGAKAGARNGTGSGAGIPPTTPMSYHITTLGCAMNEADSERMAAELESAGYAPVDDAQTAAVVVWNTCSIRDHAEQKVYSALGRHAARKWAAMGDVTLVVAGCVAQQEGSKLLRRVPEVDLVLGPQYANRLGELLDDVRTNGVQVVATEPVHVSEDLTKPRRGSGTTAWVNVIYGCLERCTYCVVPNVRGLEQSRPIAAIREEIEALAAQGIVEIVLLGQNVDAYGRDLYPRTNLTALFEAIADVPGILRYRFTTSHPRYMTERLIRTVAALRPTFANHIHLPFQSGDNTVLRRMSRGYTVERYERIVRLIREVMPDASVTADAIVAFPGETEEQFENTLALMQRLTLDTVHTAAYSPRPNTPAGAWEDQLPEAVKEDRLARINRQVTSDALKASERRVGTISEVLVEGPNPRVEGEVCGRNGQNRMVYFEGDADECAGRIVSVRITEAKAFALRGQRVWDA